MGAVEGDYLLTDDAWAEVVWVWKRTDVPRGCKTEIIDGLVAVSPYSAVAHHRITEPLRRCLYEAVPGAWRIYGRLALAVPTRLGLYVPDLAVVPEQAPRSGDEYFVDAGAAELVVEITSAATAHHDRTVKKAGYAAAGIPLYLLIDPLATDGPKVTLYSEPSDGAYGALVTREFGAPMELPAPFRLTFSVG